MPNKTKQNTKNSTKQKRSQPLYTTQTTHHTHPHPKSNPSGQLRRQPPPNNRAADAHTVLNVNPTACSSVTTLMPNPTTHPHPPPHNRAANTCRHKKTTTTPTTGAMTVPHKTGLPRKEVIQPHLPVRLPCYDFVPIANPTFDHSPHKRG